MSNLAKAGGFAMQPKTLDEAMHLANMLACSQLVPPNYKNKPEDTLVAMMMGSELGLNPIQSLQNIAVINNRPSIYGDALLALVQNHPKFGGQEESFDEGTMTATCKVWRKGEETKHVVTFSQADAQAANLWGKQGPWKQYPKRMLMWRARGYALRDKFADALGGLITVEEAQDIPEERDITPREPEPAALPYYPQEQFETNLPKWQGAIEAGKLTADQVIAKASTKGQLTDGQIAQIREVNNENA